MKEKTLNILEYDKVIDMLMEKAGSEMTRKVISELKPFDDVSQIREVFHLRLKAVPLRWRSF